MPSRLYNDVIKRIIDFVGAVFFLVITAIPMAVIALSIKLFSKGPVFYRGVRGGYKGRHFKIYKFRTMIVDAEKLSERATALDDSRITSVGKILRKTKFDEIPQLINIIKGEMSFVGPRPEILLYVNQYTEEEQCILQVRPGITDTSSLSLISLDELLGKEDDPEFEKNIAAVMARKNAMRVEYVRSQSFIRDFSLFFQTIGAVFLKIFRILFGKAEKKTAEELHDNGRTMVGKR